MQKNQLPAGFWKNPIHLLACGLGAGASPFAPGTFGTVVGVGVYMLLRPLPLGVYLGVVAALFVFGVWLCHATTRDLGVHDHSGIVWDEIVGYLVTMIAAPSGGVSIVAGFLVFRFFDVLKPWPVRWADKRVAGGFGIMLDDVLAGLYALLCMQLYRLF